MKWRRMRCAGRVACVGEWRGIYRVFKMDLQEVGCGVMDWIKLVHDSDRWQALVNAVMNHGLL